MIHELTSLDKVDAFLLEHKLSFLYVSRPECSVCHAILPKLQELLMHYPHIQLGHINANQIEAIASRFMIFAVPTMLLMVEQKEYLRADRFVRMDRLNEQIEQIYNVITHAE